MKQMSCKDYASRSDYELKPHSLDSSSDLNNTELKSQ